RGRPTAGTTAGYPRHRTQAGCPRTGRRSGSRATRAGWPGRAHPGPRHPSPPARQTWTPDGYAIGEIAVKAKLARRRSAADAVARRADLHVEVRDRPQAAMAEASENVDARD